MDAPTAVAPPVAFISGASSGLGREFAQLLAERGYSLILTARRLDRLDQLADTLRQKHQVHVITIAADLAVPADVERLIESLSATSRIDLAINNAGFGYYGAFLGQRTEQLDEMIQVNLGSLTRLTRHFAEVMKQQGGGQILQVSSYAGLQPIPRYSVYSAAKAYVIALTQGLNYEFRKCNVRTSVLCPGFMATEFHDVAQHAKTRAMRMLTTDARRVAEQGLRGLKRGQLVITPGWWYRLNNFALRFMPRSVAAALAAGIVKSKEAPSP
ncbi:MAG: SDR family oxidoreductase [Planctomycetota bacterium]|nr:SDR family oxidoreductase [Planctomycetota bacterium]